MHGMDKPLVIPDIEAVRARRKQIELEDRKLAEIEKHLLEVAQQWASFSPMHVRSSLALRPEADSMAVPEVVAPAMPGRRLTKNAAIVEALSAPRELWQTANQIRDFIVKLLGKDVPMSSVSPALTDLKNSGTIARRDMAVALVLRLEREEPSFLNENGEAEASPDADRVGPLSETNPASTGA